MITFEKSLKLIPKLKIEFSHDSAIRLDFYSKFILFYSLFSINTININLKKYSFKIKELC